MKRGKATRKRKKPHRKPVVPKREDILPDHGERLLAARFGKDTNHPILWPLINAQNSLRDAQFVAKSRGLEWSSPIISLVRHGVRKGGSLDSGHVDIAIGFFNAAAKALLARDSGFFRETARLIDQRLSLVEHRIDEAVLTCLTIIESRLEHGREKRRPTKREVREMALHWIAEKDAMCRLHPRFFSELVEYGSDGRMKYKKTFADAIKKREGELQHSFDWTLIFKRCGLSKLPSDRGGQPAHKLKFRYHY